MKVSIGGELSDIGGLRLPESSLEGIRRQSDGEYVLSLRSSSEEGNDQHLSN
jgi:hypothetical protein